MKIKQTFSRRNPVSYYSIYSPASDLLESLNRKKVIKKYDKSDAKGLRSVAPGQSRLMFTPQYWLRSSLDIDYVIG